MIELFYDDCPVTISQCAAICGDQLNWSRGDDWMAEFCTWFHVMRDGELVGFLAWVDTNKGRLMHYGTTGSGNLGPAMLKAWRMAARVAGKEDKRLCAYIESSQTQALRLAGLLGFKSKGDNFYEKRKPTEI